MKILLIVREFSTRGSGGVSYHVHHLAEALSQLGQTVSVICDYNSSKETVENPPDYVSNIYPVHLNRILPIQIEFNYLARKKVKKVNSNSEFDAIQYHAIGDWRGDHSKSSFEIYKAHMAFEHNIKLLSSEKGYRKKIPLKKELLKWYSRTVVSYLEKNSIKGTDITIYNSELTKKKINSNASRGVVIPNGVDTSVFNTEYNSCDKKDEYFLFAGGDSLRKGIEPLIDAWESYQGSVENLIIAGGVGKYYNKDYLEDRTGVQVMGLVDRNELVELYRKATALIHPAYFEPFGNVIFESLACGTPVIVSNNCHVGASEYINNHCGMTINPNNPVTITNAMNKIVSNEYLDNSNDLHNQFKSYSWEWVAKKTINTIKENNSSI